MGSMVKVENDRHGIFTADADRFVERLDTIRGSVNYDGPAHRALQAAISEATEWSYFDADVALIAIVTLELRWDNFTVMSLMSSTDENKAWREDVERRYAPMPSF